ncbi:hypothetical protein [Achromobacter spanius]|uniref:hypothetical protein n=1 Tax=Achromobacter spanius TaxID=217203 RepID=UPI003F68D505
MYQAQIIKYVAIALAIAVIGFFSSIGVLTYIFDRPIGTFAPSTSADAAGWVQAIGSIGAIVAAYFYGADQARRASKSALDLYQLDKNRIEEGCRAIVYRMRGEVGILATSTAANNARNFREVWNLHLSSPLIAAIHAFDSMPLHELGGGEAVQYACEIRSTVANVKVMIETHMARWLSSDEDASAMPNEQLETLIDEAHISLMNQIGYADTHLEGLHTNFVATKKV